MNVLERDAAIRKLKILLEIVTHKHYAENERQLEEAHVDVMSKFPMRISHRVSMSGNQSINCSTAER